MKDAWNWLSKTKDRGERFLLRETQDGTAHESVRHIHLLMLELDNPSLKEVGYGA